MLMKEGAAVTLITKIIKKWILQTIWRVFLLFLIPTICWKIPSLISTTQIIAADLIGGQILTLEAWIPVSELMGNLGFFTTTMRTIAKLKTDILIRPVILTLGWIRPIRLLVSSFLTPKPKIMAILKMERYRKTIEFLIAKRVLVSSRYHYLLPSNQINSNLLISSPHQ